MLAVQRALVVAGAGRQMAHEPLVVVLVAPSLARWARDRMRRPRSAAPLLNSGLVGACRTRLLLWWKRSLTFNGRFKLSRSQEVLGLAAGARSSARLTGAAIRYLLASRAVVGLFAFGKENNAFGNEYERQRIGGRLAKNLGQEMERS